MQDRFGRVEVMTAEATLKPFIKKVVTAKPNMRVSEVVSLMKHYNIGSIIISEDKKTPLGIFTERDVCYKIVAGHRNPLAVAVSDVMTRKLISIKTTDPIERAFEALAVGRFRHVPVMEGSKIAGMVSLTDMARILYKHWAAVSKKGVPTSNFPPSLFAREVITIAPDDFAFRAAQKMKRRNVGSCVAVENKETPPAGIQGILTERDLVRRLIAENRSILNTLVSDIMTKKVMSVAVNEPLDKAILMLAQGKFRHVPVRDGRKIVGMFSISDLVKLLQFS